jgi:predicted Zn finger-like uncharacterized protein
MTVECPACKTIFPVDPNKVPVRGVHARCSSCSQVFFVEPPTLTRVQESDTAEPHHDPPGEAAMPEEGVAVEAAASVPGETAPILTEEVAEEEPAEPEAVEPLPEIPEPWAPEAEVEEAEPEPWAPEAVEPLPEIPEPEPWAPEAEVEEAEPEAADHELDSEVGWYGAPEPEVEVAEAEPAEPEAVEPLPEIPEPEPWAPEAEVEEAEPSPEGPEAPPRATEPTFGDPEPTFTMDSPTLGVAPPGEEHVEEPEPAFRAPASAEAPAPAAPMFGRRDPLDKAQRLARVLVSDIVLYNPDRHRSALNTGRTRDEFADEIRKSWVEYVEQVGEDIATSTSFFDDALTEILEGGPGLG